MCPQCGGVSIVVKPYDYGVCRETGYHDAVRMLRLWSRGRRKRNRMRSIRSRCRVIVRSGMLMPGMVMPTLGPPPPDPHPNRKIQEMREAWDLRIISWEGIWPDGVRPGFHARRQGMHLGRGAA